MQLCKTVHLSCSTHALYVIWSHIHASAFRETMLHSRWGPVAPRPSHPALPKEERCENFVRHVCEGVSRTCLGVELGCECWDVSEIKLTQFQPRASKSCHDPTILHKTRSTVVELQIFNSLFTIDALRLVVSKFSANTGNPWKPCWPPVIAELIVEVPWYSEGIVGKCRRLFCLPPKMW